MNSAGVDIGGTFTDLVGYRDGNLVLSKTLTVPSDPTAGVAGAMTQANVSIAQLDEFLHGSTTAINTVLERKGAATALITTQGFRDVYEIGRGNRPDAFDIHFQRPLPLVPRHLRFEVPERMNAQGDVLTPLDEAAVLALGKHLVEAGVASVALCFLHSYANPSHELLAGRLLRNAHPEIFVTLSCEILREAREYERTSTTVLNAYVGPRVSNYLRTLNAHLGDRGFRGTIQIMRSNGGSMSLAHAAREPVSMMESGPVAGMIAAGHVAQLLGMPRVIGFDMGGTTAKATLIVDGVPAIEDGYYIGGYSTGQPMQLPVVSIIEVGAGGGSVARCDAGGLHVGPESAGADPGPACYGRGGKEPTVTDANLLLGRLNPERFLGGGMGLDVDAATRAMMKQVAQPLQMSALEAASGVVRIADTEMALAVRAVSVRKGVDPRDAAMIAFGGAGPVHAASLCREIYIPTLVIPKLPGNFSALGMLLAPWRLDVVRTFVSDWRELDTVRVTAVFDDLLTTAQQQMVSDGLRVDEGVAEFFADLRYRGQEHSIPVLIPSPRALGERSEQVRSAFDTLHQMRYGHAAAGESIEVAALRLTMSLPRRDSPIEAYLREPFVAEAPRPEQQRKVVYSDPAQPVDARILWRPSLPAGFTFEGPAIVEEPNSTTVLFPGDSAYVTEHGHIVVTINLA